jgi:hypothetical protein
MPEVLPLLILAAAPSLRDASNAAAFHVWFAAFILPPSSHRSRHPPPPHTAHLGRPQSFRAARRLARPAGQDQYITNDDEGPDARSALVDRCAILAPADFASRYLCVPIDF